MHNKGITKPKKYAGVGRPVQYQLAKNLTALHIEFPCNLNPAKHIIDIYLHLVLTRNKITSKYLLTDEIKCQRHFHVPVHIIFVCDSIQQIGLDRSETNEPGNDRCT